MRLLVTLAGPDRRSSIRRLQRPLPRGGIAALAVVEDLQVVGQPADLRGHPGTCTGERDILGLWAGGGEGAKFRLAVLTEIKNRGTTDV